jgi:hypothetical protein
MNSASSRLRILLWKICGLRSAGNSQTGQRAAASGDASVFLLQQTACFHGLEASARKIPKIDARYANKRLSTEARSDGDASKLTAAAKEKAAR